MVILTNKNELSCLTLYCQNQLNLYYELSLSKLIMLSINLIILAPLFYTITIGDKDINAGQAKTMISI